MFLEFNYFILCFIFYVKMPNTLGPTPKFKIALPRLFCPGQGFQKGISHPSRTKTQGGDRFSRTGCFQPSHTLEAGWSATPAQKLLVRSCTSPEKFIKILSFLQKLFTFLRRTEPDTAPIHIPVGKNLYACFWYLSLHYVRFAHSVHEG